MRTQFKILESFFDEKTKHVTMLLDGEIPRMDDGTGRLMPPVIQSKLGLWFEVITSETMMNGERELVEVFAIKSGHGFHENAVPQVGEDLVLVVPMLYTELDANLYCTHCGTSNGVESCMSGMIEDDDRTFCAGCARPIKR